MKKRINPGIVVLVILAAVGVALYVDNMSQPANTPLSQPQQKAAHPSRKKKEQIEEQQANAKKGQTTSVTEQGKANTPDKKSDNKAMTPDQKAMRHAAQMAGAGV